MASSNSAWGIEVGAHAIKAIRLDRDGDQVMVSDFSVIPHKKVLTTPDLDQNEMIRLGLGQFISQKALEGETLVMSIPGHAAFARFAKLPPVEPKKVPDIVKFEAVQQIPFPIDEVEWDYQTFTSADSPEVEVGIFAITRERVQQRLALYAELGISPEALNLSPVSVYNAMAYDHDLAARKMAVIYLDIGTSATDVVVANEGQCWIRTFPLGGTHFTEAIANSFKLSYSKAEKLKQEAATSKYAKQIMQAMRPVFTDLLQDVQRSLGYYQSLHRDVELKTMVGLGSTFKIPGLRKFLGQQLQMDVVRLDEFRKIRVEGREAASFSENAVNMATAYGLALQGVGLGKIDVNLVPVKVLREHLWHSKIKWFAAAAAVAIVGGAATFIRPMSDTQALVGDGPVELDQAISQGRALADQFRQIVERNNQIGFKGENIRRLLDFRTVWPYIVRDSGAALASSNPQRELFSGDIGEIRSIPAADRRLIELKHLGGAYVPPGQDGKRYLDVTATVEFSNSDPAQFLNSTVEKWLRENAEPTGDRASVPYRILTDTIRSDLANIQKLSVPLPQAVEEAEGNRPAPPQLPGGDRNRRPILPEPPSGGGGGAIPGGGGVGGGAGGGTGEDIGPQTPPGGGRRGGGGFGGGGGPAIPGGGGVGEGGGGMGEPIGPAFPGGGGGARGGGGGAGAPIGPPGGGSYGGQKYNEREIQDLNNDAPLEAPPLLLEPGTRYFRTTISFRVELLDPRFDDQADQTADAGRNSEEDRS